MRKTITSVIAITITAVSVALVKKIISDKFHDDDVDVEIIDNDVDEICTTPSSSIDEEDEGLSIRIDEDDDIISAIKFLMADECSSFKYAVLEAALSQAENGEIKKCIETMELIGEEI